MNKEVHELEFEDKWPIFEKILGYLRYLKIRKYIKIDDQTKPVCVDIGCGFNGRFLRSISTKIKQGYGFDLRANEHVYNNVEVINNSSIDGNLPLQSSIIDRVFMLAVIEHLDMDNNLVSEGARVLKSNGMFIMTTPTPTAKGVLEFLSYKLHLISEDSIREHKHYYTEKELKNIIEMNEMDVVVYKKFQFGFNQLIVGKKH